MEVGGRRQALTEGVAAGILFGTAAVFTRYAQGTDPFSIVFWRLAIAAVTLGVASIAFRRALRLKFMKENAKEIVVLGLLLGFHFIFFTASVNDTTILNATVLVNTVPFFSILLSVLVFKKTPSSLALVGLVFSFVGVLIITFGEAASIVPETVVRSGLRGDFEAIVAAAFLALYLGFGEKVRNRSSVLTVMFPIYGSAMCIVAFISLMTTNGFSILRPIPNGFLPLIGLGLLPTAIAHTLYFSSLRGLRPFETAMMALLEPVGATILGIAVFEEVPAPIFVLGAVLVLVGIMFAVKRRSQNNG